MTVPSISLVRGVVLAFAIGALLSGTVLFPLLRRLLGERIRRAHRVTTAARDSDADLFTRVVENDGLLRAWQLLCAAVGFLLWWYLGTPKGAAWLLARLGSR